MSEDQTKTEATNTEATDVTTEATEAQPERVKQMVYFDAAGTEIFRKNLTRGRRPSGAVEQANGDVHIPNCTLDSTTGNPVLPTVKKDRPQIFQIELDPDGNVVKKVEKGRGRPLEGYEKQADGEYAGHWVKRNKVEATVEVTPEVANTETEEAVEAEAVEVNAEANEVEEGWEEVPSDEPTTANA